MIYLCTHCGYPNELHKRSNQQNKFFHLCVGIMAEHTGYNFEEMKAVLKYQFGYYKECVNKKTGESIIVYDETSRMTMQQIAEFTEKILILANSNGITIKTPEEYFETT